MASDKRYVQTLPELDLAIERATERTPDDTQFHLLRGDEIISSFKKLGDAQKAFAKAKDDSGWTPPARAGLEPGEKVAREKAAQDRLAYLEYWSTSHQFRGGGKPKRRQR